MELINRNTFLKVNLMVVVSVLISPYFSIASAEVKTYLIDCLLPKRVFLEGGNPAEIRLTKVVDNPADKIVQFILSNNLKLSYKYSDVVTEITRRSQREAMKLKILLSYSLYNLCQDDRKKIERNKRCNGDTMQTQEFLEGLKIDEFTYILNSFKPAK